MPKSPICQFSNTQVYDTLMASLAAMGVETIPTVGEDFDYNLHMAIQTVPSDEIEEDKVAEEMQAGFTCQGRLVRPALRGCGAPYRRTSWSRRGLRGYGKYAVVYFIVRGCGCCFLTVGEGQIDIPKFLVVSKYIPLARTTYYTPHVIFKCVLLKKINSHRRKITVHPQNVLLVERPYFATNHALLMVTSSNDTGVVPRRACSSRRRGSTVRHRASYA